VFVSMSISISQSNLYIYISISISISISIFISKSISIHIYTYLYIYIYIYINEPPNATALIAEQWAPALAGCFGEVARHNNGSTCRDAHTQTHALTLYRHSDTRIPQHHMKLQWMLKQSTQSIETNTLISHKQPCLPRQPASLRPMEMTSAAPKNNTKLNMAPQWLSTVTHSDTHTHTHTYTHTRGRVYV